MTTTATNPSDAISILRSSPVPAPTEGSRVGDGLEQQGFDAAAATLGELDALRLALRRIAEQTASVDAEHRAAIQRRIDDIGVEIEKIEKAAEAASKAGSEEIARASRRIDDLAASRAAVEQEIARLRLHPEPGDFHPVKFAVMILVLVVLTAYLLVFYPSILYTAVFSNLGEDLTRALGEAPGLLHLFNGILNPRALEEALRSPFAFAWVMLFAGFPLAIGVVTHATLDSEWPWLGKVGVLACLLTLAFAVDAVIAYRISQRLHEARYLTGGTDQAWTPMAWAADVNFWFVILIGFGAYVVWGLLLLFVLKEDQARHPERRAIQRLLGEAARLQKEFQQARRAQTSAEAAAKSWADEYSPAREALLASRERATRDLGLRVVRWSELEARLDDFTKGWVRFLAHFGSASATPAAATATLAEKKAELRLAYAPVDEEASR